MSFEEAKAVVFNGKSGLWIWLFFGLRNWVLGFLPRMDLGSKFFLISRRFAWEEEGWID